jgi:hypothetical protein
MSVFLERFLLTLLAAIAGATILTNPWRLDRVQQASLIVAIIALAVLAGRTIENSRSVPAGTEQAQVPRPFAERPQTQSEAQVGTQLAQQPPHLGPQPNPPKPLVTLPTDVADEPLKDSESILSAATAAAEHYKKTSPTLKREEIRKEYAAICDRVAKTFGFGGWGPKNTITRMVDLNWGDLEPYERAEQELPNAALVAVRTLVAFETEKERPMHMAYVFVGRAASGDEVVVTFDEEKAWNIISVNASNYEAIMRGTVQKDLDRLTKLIAMDIAKIK